MRDITLAAWTLYILRCADGSLYTGITTDLERRCRQHNRGTASRYTRGRCPVQVVYRETCSSQSGALKREAAVKALSRRQKQALIARASKKRGPLKRRRGSDPFF
jgi:predicted GIY-YIG superfamily endonuclease